MNVIARIARVSGSLCRRELVRFYRQKSRIVGVIGSPLVFWFLIGSGLSNSFRHPQDHSGMNYLEYFYPGTMTLVILFTSIFSTISIIEDRREGFLQSVIVSPAPRSGIVLGKILGGTLLALLQALILLMLAPFLGIALTAQSIFLVSGILFILGFGSTGLGFLIAWKMESSQGFHAIMNLFLIPLWILSGALFPAAGASPWLGRVMMFNPLTYGLTALRIGIYSGLPSHGADAGDLALPLAVTIAFSLLTFIFSTFLVKRSDHGAS